VNKLQATLDAFISLALTIPLSFIGTFFGDAIRKEILTPRQRFAVMLLSFVMGPICGAIANRELGFGEFTSYAIAAIAPTLTYDIIGFVVAIIQAAKNDPDDMVEFFKSIFPWGRK
jgi:uncharacterized membrane protein YoaK (UPF0700 family)